MPPRRKLQILGPLFPTDVKDEDFTDECNMMYSTSPTDDPNFVQVVEYQLCNISMTMMKFHKGDECDNGLIPTSYAPHFRFINHLRIFGMLWHYLRDHHTSEAMETWDKMTIYLTKLVNLFLAMAADAVEATDMTPKWQCTPFDNLLT
ncbi:hypothetical protein JAAARDRAFT_198084 [Jaapia argillacea MUCL 33604]|uniref:Uncharacterized protein n=1 Tax=Jaapia argillacea MUCL 33604 TaxID=933084 RepID=A0A067PN69_9AGAM|nr:hypothetical protein JAAARDRAFT_198084 [Jaapia argillacea MUCL 33604]